MFGFVNRHRIRHGCCGEENIIKQAGWLKSASFIVSEEYIWRSISDPRVQNTPGFPFFQKSVPGMVFLVQS